MIVVSTADVMVPVPVVIVIWPERFVAPVVKAHVAPVPAADPTAQVGDVPVPRIEAVVVLGMEFTVQAAPRVQVVPLTVVEELANAVLGIAEAVKFSVGVVVGFATVRPRKDGSVPADTEVTVPPPPDAGTQGVHGPLADAWQYRPIAGG